MEALEVATMESNINLDHSHSKSSSHGHALSDSGFSLMDQGIATRMLNSSL
jgi:hypothetical protein